MKTLTRCASVAAALGLDHGGAFHARARVRAVSFVARGCAFGLRVALTVAPAPVAVSAAIHGHPRATLCAHPRSRLWPRGASRACWRLGRTAGPHVGLLSWELWRLWDCGGISDCCGMLWEWPLGPNKRGGRLMGLGASSHVERSTLARGHKTPSKRLFTKRLRSVRIIYKVIMISKNCHAKSRLSPRPQYQPSQSSPLRVDVED